MKTTLIIMGYLLLGGVIMAGEENQSTNLIFNGSFENWEWAPLDSDRVVLEQARKRMKWKENINIDCRGPLYRRPVGYGASVGRMVEGPEAHQGKSLYLVNDWKDGEWMVIGFHGPYGSLLETGQEYNWEIWLKGSGAFVFKAYIWGLKGGEGKLLGVPDLIKVSVTNTWQCYQGKFKVPVLEEGDCKQDKKVSAAIVILKDSAVYIDNFRVWR